MNLENNPGIDELRELLRACDDRAAHHVLWVARNGDVRVARIPKHVPPAAWHDTDPDVQIRWETFQAGNEYVGPEAAEDDGWVRQSFDTLVKEWPRARGKQAVESLAATV